MALAQLAPRTRAPRHYSVLSDSALPPVARWRMNSPKALDGMLSPSLESRVKPNFPFTIQIQPLGILTSSAVLAVVMAAITFVLIDGFYLTTVNATALSDDDKSDLLDKYNSYTAAVAGVVTLPFSMFASSLLSLFFLGFWTKAMLASGKSILARWIPTVIGFALTWVLGQGLNALNVQFNAPTYEYAIQASDLATTSTNESYANVATYVTNTSHDAGNPRTDTILRSAIRSPSLNTTTTCATGGHLLGTPVSVLYDFRLNSWLGELLSESVAADESFSFSLGNDYSNQELDASEIPGGNVAKTAQLFTYGFWTLWRHFGYEASVSISEPTGILEAVQSEDGAEMISNIQDLIANFTAQLEADGSNLGVGTWLNVSSRSSSPTSSSRRRSSLSP